MTEDGSVDFRQRSFVLCVSSDLFFDLPGLDLLLRIYPHPRMLLSLLYLFPYGQVAVSILVAISIGLSTRRSI